MLRLRCAYQTNISLQSRIAVLDIADPKYDYALAAGHAVPEDRPCDAQDFNGVSERVDIIRFPPNYRAGEKTDWAVIRFPRIDNPNLVRYRLEPLADLENLEGVEVRFAKALGLSENSQKCRLTLLRFSETDQKVAHDCRGVPGQSGSPVTRIVEGEHRLVGINVGRIWMFESPQTGRPDRKGYINLFDQQIIEDIGNLIAEIQGSET